MSVNRNRIRKIGEKKILEKIMSGRKLLFAINRKLDRLFFEESSFSETIDFLFFGIIYFRIYRVLGNVKIEMSFFVRTVKIRIRLNLEYGRNLIRNISHFITFYNNTIIWLTELIYLFFFFAIGKILTDWIVSYGWLFHYFNRNLCTGDKIIRKKRPTASISSQYCIYYISPSIVVLPITRIQNLKFLFVVVYIRIRIVFFCTQIWNMFFF